MEAIVRTGLQWKISRGGLQEYQVQDQGNKIILLVTFLNIRMIKGNKTYQKNILAFGYLSAMDLHE